MDFNQGQAQDLCQEEPRVWAHPGDRSGRIRDGPSDLFWGHTELLKWLSISWKHLLQVKGVWWYKTDLKNHRAGDPRSPCSGMGEQRQRSSGNLSKSIASPVPLRKLLLHNLHSRYSTSNLFSASKSGLPHPELEQHQGAQFFREEGACGRNNSKAPNQYQSIKQTSLARIFSLLFPLFTKCLTPWLSGKCDKFDQEKKNFSPSSIKFCGCPERRWSLDSSRIYDCKQTVILLHNCPTALLWNILKFYGIEKVSIF